MRIADAVVRISVIAGAALAREGVPWRRLGLGRADWPKDLLKDWDQLSADEKKMFIRQVEVFAAYVAYTDHEIGRVIQAVEDMGKLDNTLIIYINGDNGTSAGGTLIGTPNGDAPSVLNSSYNFRAEVEVPEGGGEGMLITQGGRFAGYGFYLLKGKPVCTWNLVDLKRVKWESPEALSPGRHVIEFDFRYDGLGMATLAFNNVSGIGQGGTGVLKVDGKEVATQKMEHTIQFILQWDENLDVGSDTGSPVDDKDYQTPFAFNGKIEKITLTIDRPQLTPEDIKKLETAQRNNKVSE